jgi:rhodanese-related sulfurtransferase
MERRKLAAILSVIIIAAFISSLFLLKLYRPTPSPIGYEDVTAPELHSMLENKDFLLINTHIPYEGEIEGTDLFIPYNDTQSHLDKLPIDKNAKIVVYCMSDRMSNIAAKELVELGYTNVLNLDGGMISWKESGYNLIY